MLIRPKYCNKFSFFQCLLYFVLQHPFFNQFFLNILENYVVEKSNYLFLLKHCNYNERREF